MYKVLLVDDEPMALEGLKYVVDWGTLGFSICGTCCNGKEAADAMDKYEPDVIITDIKMPVMDGMDLIRYAREHGKENIKFIVVSGYGEFEYAKKAMQYAVRFFLQKPIFQEEIYEIIIEVKKNLDQICRDKESAKMDQKAILDGVLGNLLWGSDSEEAFEYIKSFWDEDTFLMGWNCVVIELECSDRRDVNHESKKIRLKVLKAIDQGIKSISGTFVLEQSSNTFIILTSLNNEEQQKNKINYMAKRIYENLDLVVSSGFTIGVGENVVGLNAVKHSYTTAVVALGYRFYRGMPCLIFYNEIKEKTYNFEFNDLFMSSKVLEEVQELQSNKIENVISATFEYFKINRIDPDIVIMFTSNMICKINNLIYQFDHKSKEFVDNHTILELKDHERTMEELKKFFQLFCLGCCEYFKKVRYSNSESTISKIESFINENYKRNITIRELSKKVYMHPTYLGQLFIRKFGIGFNEYVHRLRIEEAKRLMNGTDLKNYEIAEGIGYNNYNSFLQQFEKFTGMKPTEFRNI